MAEKRIYVDTNVYMDLFENRSDRLRPLGEFAHQLFKRTFNCEFKIIISSEVIRELEKHGHNDRIKTMMDELKGYNKLDFVHTEKNDMNKAAKRKDISHFNDRLHYILAEKANAEMFITRNWADFCGLGDLPILLPEYA